MPIAILLIVGIVFYSNANKETIDAQDSTTSKVEITIAPEIKPVINKIKQEPVSEPAKEVVKQELAKEVVKQELAKEVVKQEPVSEPDKEEIDIEEPATNYLKIILYIIAAIATIFGGFYFFSNRGNNQSSEITVDNSRKDIEESFQPESQEQQPAQEEIQKDNQEQQSSQEEIQTETQEQQSSQEENQTETQEQQNTEDDENTNKQ
jgi:uncharacterized protein HemX